MWIVVHPMPQAEENQLADDRMVAIDRVAAAGIVAVVAAAVAEHVVDAVFQPLEAEGRAEFVAFGRVVEDDVEDHFDARIDAVRWTICLNSRTDAAGSRAGRVTVVRREERQRIVAPVVRPSQIHAPAGFHGELVDRHQFDRRHAE